MKTVQEQCYQDFVCKPVRQRTGARVEAKFPPETLRHEYQHMSGPVLLFSKQIYIFFYTLIQDIFLYIMRVNNVRMLFPKRNANKGSADEVPNKGTSVPHLSGGKASMTCAKLSQLYSR